MFRFAHFACYFLTVTLIWTKSENNEADDENEASHQQMPFGIRDIALLFTHPERYSSVTKEGCQPLATAWPGPPDPLTQIVEFVNTFDIGLAAYQASFAIKLCNPQTTASASASGETELFFEQSESNETVESFLTKSIASSNTVCQSNSLVDLKCVKHVKELFNNSRGNRDYAPNILLIFPGPNSQSAVENIDYDFKVEVVLAVPQKFAFDKDMKLLDAESNFLKSLAHNLNIKHVLVFNNSKQIRQFLDDKFYNYFYTDCEWDEKEELKYAHIPDLNEPRCECRKTVSKIRRQPKPPEVGRPCPAVGTMSDWYPCACPEPTATTTRKPRPVTYENEIDQGQLMPVKLSEPTPKTKVWPYVIGSLLALIAVVALVVVGAVVVVRRRRRRARFQEQQADEAASPKHHADDDDEEFAEETGTPKKTVEKSDKAAEEEESTESQKKRKSTKEKAEEEGDEEAPSKKTNQPTNPTEKDISSTGKTSKDESTTGKLDPKKFLSATDKVIIDPKLDTDHPAASQSERLGLSQTNTSSDPRVKSSPAQIKGE